jgi:hypothetical protein
MKKLFLILICLGGWTLVSCEDDRRAHSGGHDAGRTTPGIFERDDTTEPDTRTGTTGTGTTTDTLHRAPETSPGTTR